MKKTTFTSKASFAKIKFEAINVAGFFDRLNITTSHPRFSVRNYVLKNFANSTGKQVLGFFDEVAGLRVCNFIEKRLQHRCFNVSFAKFLKTSILKNIWKRLLLNVSYILQQNSQYWNYIVLTLFKKILQVKWNPIIIFHFIVVTI